MRKSGFLSPSMQRQKLNHALSRVHGSARAFPSVETFFSFLTWVLAQRAIATPMSFGVSKRILQSPCKRFRGNLSLPKRWDNFTSSQTRDSLQAETAVRLKPSADTAWGVAFGRYFRAISEGCLVRGATPSLQRWSRTGDLIGSGGYLG